MNYHNDERLRQRAIEWVGSAAKTDAVGCHHFAAVEIERAVQKERERTLADVDAAHEDDCPGYHCPICHLIKEFKDKISA